MRRIDMNEVGYESCVMIVHSNWNVSELKGGSLEFVESRCHMTKKLKDEIERRLLRLLSQGRNAAMAKEVVVWYNFGNLKVGAEYMMPRIVFLDRRNLVRRYLEIYNIYRKKGRLL